jgi:cytochrome P450
VTAVAPLYDPFSWELHEDPYPTYRVLRDEHPVYFNEQRELWALSRYADVRAALHDPDTYSSAQGVTLEDAQAFIGGVVITTDPPRHTQLRALLSRAFTPRRIDALAPVVAEACTRMLGDGVTPGEPFDIQALLGKPLPTMVIGELLGVPDADRVALLEWSDALLHREPGFEGYTDEGTKAAAALYEYFVGLVEARRADAARGNPGDDLVSALIAAEVDGERLTDHEIHAFGFLLFVAGNETTTSLIGNASWYLAHHPDQRELLREQPDLIPSALEELLRYDAPTQCLRRTLTRDVELHGVTMREGEMVNLLFGAANRDERAFEDPDRFDVTRQPQGHLAFGHGAHFCLGAALARLEARIALGEMLERMPGWEVTAPAPARVHSGNQRGFTSLHLAVPG